MKEDVKNALQRRASEVEAQAEFIMAKTRDWQVIQEYMTNRLAVNPLTPEQEKKMERYQFIINELLSGKNTNVQIVNQIRNFFKISITQAYDDMNAAKELLPQMISVKRQFEIQLALELNTKYMQKAEAMGDMKALAAFEKNRANLLKLLPEEEQKPVDFQGHIYELTFDPKLLGAPAIDMKELLQSINAKRNKPINIDMFEELEHEDVPKDDN